MSIVKHKYGDATSSVSGTRQNSMRWRVNQMPTSTTAISRRRTMNNGPMRHAANFIVH
jgi:hypothetical protein